MSRRVRWLGRFALMRTPKRPKLHDIAAALATLPPGQRRVAEALVSQDHAPTYAELAVQLGLHVGTVYQHLKRIRDGRPEVYKFILDRRAAQLAERHRRAVVRARAHS